MNYRIYYQSLYGYDKIEGTFTYSEMLQKVKELILNGTSKILVIEHNIEFDYDNPCFLYTGDYQEYENYINDEKEKVLRRKL